MQWENHILSLHAHACAQHTCITHNVTNKVHVCSRLGYIWTQVALVQLTLFLCHAVATKNYYW